MLAYLRLSLIALILFAAPATADLYWNSLESGCVIGSLNADYLFCDDFEDGGWAQTCSDLNPACCVNDSNCPPNGESNPENDGWVMYIFGGNTYFPDPAGEDYALCGNLGFQSDCTSTSGPIVGNEHRGPGGACNGGCPDAGIGMNGRHFFYPNHVTTDEVYIRWYYKLDANYDWGFTKIMSIEDLGASFRPLFLKLEGNIDGSGCGGIRIVNQASDTSLSQNIGTSICMEREKWYYFELHYKLDTNGSNGIVELWIDDCGVNADQCTQAVIGTGTLRLSYTDQSINGPGNTFGQIWVENWGNGGPVGVTYQDQYIVSKTRVGPMGFTAPPASTPTFSGVMLSLYERIQLMFKTTGHAWAEAW